MFWGNTGTNKEEKTPRLFPHWVLADGSVLQKIFNNTIFSLLTFLKLFQLLSDCYETHNKSSYKIKYIENGPICLLCQVFSCFGAQWALFLASLANSLGKHPWKKKSESLRLTCLETAGEPPNPYLCHMTYVFEPHSGAVFLNETSIPYLYKNI